MAYKKKLINKIQEIEDELQTLNRTNSANPERVLINAALFITAISSLDEARNRTRPDGYEQKSKYMFYQDTVSGPCYELFKQMLKDIHGNKEERKVSSGDFISLAKQVTEKFESRLAKGNIENYKNSNEGMNYSVLYEDIAKIESVNLKNTINLNIPDLLELVIDCYEDMSIRVIEYNNKQRKKSAKRRLIDKARTKETGEMQEDGIEENKTDIRIRISRSDCYNTILKLNNVYKKLENSNRKKSKFLREKLEQILIPVYCSSPYFVLCISHKNMLPKDILKDYKPKRNFVYVIVAVTYELSTNANGRQEYLASYNVVSQEYVSRFNKRSFDIESRDINIKIKNKFDIGFTDKNNRIKRKFELESTDKNNRINKRFYINASDNTCCADLYNNMMFKYKDCCRFFNQDLAWHDAEKHWFPLDLPSGIYNDLKSLYVDTNHFEFSSLLRETEEFGKDILLDNVTGKQYYDEYEKSKSIDSKDETSQIAPWSKRAAR